MALPILLTVAIVGVMIVGFYWSRGRDRD